MSAVIKAETDRHFEAKTSSYEKHAPATMPDGFKKRAHNPSLSRLRPVIEETYEEFEASFGDYESPTDSSDKGPFKAIISNISANGVLNSLSDSSRGVLRGVVKAINHLLNSSAAEDVDASNVEQIFGNIARRNLDSRVTESAGCLECKFPKRKKSI